MNHEARRNRKTAVTSLLLSLPFSLLITAYVLGLETDLSSLVPLLKMQETHIGSLIVLAAFGLLVAACAVSSASAVRTVRAGLQLKTNVLNLALAAFTVIVILGVAGAVIADQYPCWVGVPNCD